MCVCVNKNDYLRSIYRPEINPDKTRLEVSVPAPPAERMLVDRTHRDGREAGVEAKMKRYSEESWRSACQRQANVRTSQDSELQETIYGRGKTIEKPILYPQKLSHQMALTLEGRVGPRLPFDQEPPKSKEPFAKWDQTMYVPYSRTRSQVLADQERSKTQTTTSLW